MWVRDLDPVLDYLNTTTMLLSRITSFFPIIKVLSTYTTTILIKDLIAGITIATFAIPQSIAYASLAGIPPIYGLYTSFVPVIVYALLGTGRHSRMYLVMMTDIQYRLMF